MRTPTKTSSVVSGRGHRMRRPLLVAVLAAGLVVTGSPAAQAQIITDADAAGDMVQIDWDWEGGSPSDTQPGPQRERLTPTADPATTFSGRR